MSEDSYEDNYDTNYSEDDEVEGIERESKSYDMINDPSFIEDEYERCIHIGIGFVRKMCRVKCETVRYEL